MSLNLCVFLILNRIIIFIEWKLRILSYILFTIEVEVKKTDQ